MMQVECDNNKSGIEELCEAIAKREPKAIERWFGDYADAVYNYVYHKVSKNKELACDIVQETFLEGITKITEYDPKKASMYVWLIFISRNHIKRAIRSNKRSLVDSNSQSQNSKYMEYCKNLSRQVIPDEIVHSREIAELVHITLDDIPANYGEILRQYYYTGDSLKKIASIKQITEGAAKVLLHRARKSFEKAFVKLAGDLDFTGGK